MSQTAVKPSTSSKEFTMQKQTSPFSVSFVVSGFQAEGNFFFYLHLSKLINCAICKRLILIFFFNWVFNAILKQNQLTPRK